MNHSNLFLNYTMSKGNHKFYKHCWHLHSTQSDIDCYNCFRTKEEVYHSHFGKKCKHSDLEYKSYKGSYNLS